MVALLAIIGNTILVEVRDSVNESGVLVNQSVDTLNKGIDAMRLYDTMMPFILIGLAISAVVLAFLTPTHPVLLVPVIFVSAIFMIVFAQFSNIYTQIVSTPVLLPEANQFVVTAQIMNNLPTVGLILIIIISLGMFVLSRRGREFGG